MVTNTQNLCSNPSKVQTHSSEHTNTPWTHTRSSGQSFMLQRPGSSWGSVPCSRAPQSWYWRWRECWTFTPPHLQFLQAQDSNKQPLDYESNSLTIRPWLLMSIVNLQCPESLIIKTKTFFCELSWVWFFHSKHLMGRNKPGLKSMAQYFFVI